MKKHPRTYSIRQHLFLLAMTAVIPVLVFTVILVADLANENGKVQESNLKSVARTLKVAVDEQTISALSGLKILAEVEDFHPSRIQFLHSRLRRFVEGQDVLGEIALVDTKGRQVFNSRHSFSKKLPRLSSHPDFRKMLEEKRPIIGGKDPEAFVRLMVPVIRNGLVVYAIVGSLSKTSFERIFKAQRLPNTWQALILDQKGNVIDQSGAIETRPQNPTRLSSRSHTSGWTFLLLVPEGEGFSYWKFLKLMLLATFGFLGLGLLLASYWGKKISTPLRTLAARARAIGQGRDFETMKTTLSEANEVSEVLTWAAKQRDQSERQIQSLYEKEQEAVKNRDTFLSVASHELKTPITTLKLQLQLLARSMAKKGSMTSEETEKPIGRVMGQTDRLIRLIDDLLDVTRINSGRLEYHPEPFDLAVEVQEIIQQFQGEARTAGARIDYEGPQTLPGHWDRHRFDQVISNLITNAIKYGDGRPFCITLTSSEGMATISVADQGIGIASEHLDRVFERFERSTNVNGVSGLGLGLWIVKRILEGLGGTIEVSSSLGNGTTFTVRIPIGEQILENESVSDLSLTS